MLILKTAKGCINSGLILTPTTVCRVCDTQKPYDWAVKTGSEILNDKVMLSKLRNLGNKAGVAYPVVNDSCVTLGMATLQQTNTSNLRLRQVEPNVIDGFVFDTVLTFKDFATEDAFTSEGEGIFYVNNKRAGKFYTGGTLKNIVMAQVKDTALGIDYVNIVIQGVQGVETVFELHKIDGDLYLWTDSKFVRV